MLTDAEAKHINDVVEQCTGKPPKRIYPDDVMALVGIIWRLLQLLDER